MTALLLTCGKAVDCGCHVFPPSVEKLCAISFMQRESIQSVPSNQIAINFLFHPLSSLPAEGPGSVGGRRQVPSAAGSAEECTM